MYCGGCFRDNALTAALRRAGRDTLMVPLYLPLNLEEPDQSAGTPIFFSGINVYLEQKYPIFSKAPSWVRRWFTAPGLLRGIGRRAVKIRPEETGDLTLSMLRGEEGQQAREIEELILWLKTQSDIGVVCLSNALLIGMARRLKKELKIPVVCTFQGEDSFLDALPDAQRRSAYALLTDRARDIDLFIAPSRYFAELMKKRLSLPDRQVKVVFNGISLAGYSPAKEPPAPPAIGFFARMCPEKGLDFLVEAFLVLKMRNRLPDLRLLVGGSLSPSDQPFVDSVQMRLRRASAMQDARFFPNLDRAAKQDFYRSLSLLCMPTKHPEAFGLYVPEALASGVPVVLPRQGSFPELIEASGAGVLCESKKPNALADVIESVLLNPNRYQELREAALKSGREIFDIDRMARDMIQIYDGLK
jgi:glycosyltransferase involved in cell wall biosynthesis